MSPVEEILDMQNRACAICRKGEGKARGLHMDRDGDARIRGFICSECKVGLATFHRNPTLLRIAANYLQEVLV